MFNVYEFMSSRMAKQADFNIHWQNLTLSLLSMFDYDGLPDTIRPELIEMLLISQGTCGITEINGELYTGVGGYCGEEKNFLNVDYIITNVGIGEKTFTVNKNGVVGWNNSLRLPDLMIQQYANILTEIDVSERLNVLFARFLRIPRVKDSKEKSAIEDAVKQIMAGTFQAVISKNIQQDILATAAQHPENQFIDLTDVDKIDKLQYLNQARDNYIKRWFQVYGQGMQNTAKLAQQSTDELHGNDAVSMIIPLDRLKCRQRLCDQINAMYGTNITVKFSDAYAESYEEMQETYSNGTRETTPESGGAGDENNQD